MVDRMKAAIGPAASIRFLTPPHGVRRQGPSRLPGPRKRIL